MNKEVAINRITKALETPTNYLRTGGVIKQEFNRVEFVSIIRDYSGEEYETMNDLWDLAFMDEEDLKHQVIGLRHYFLVELNQEDNKRYF